MEIGLVYAILGIAIAVVLAGFGSAIGIKISGQAANGVMSENPENFVSLLILTALPGTQGIYGFVDGFMVLLKLGLLGGTVANITPVEGLQILGACIPVGLAGLMSAIQQGWVCASGVEMLARQPKELVKPLMLGVLVEFYAILGFTVSFLLINGIKLH